jgi:hypothetical protein
VLATLFRLLRRRQPDNESQAAFARESAQGTPNGRLLRPPRGPVLMLDIDGVLHPAQAGTLIYLPSLERWLREQPLVDVVIASNWRDTHTLDELRAFFSPELRWRVIGTTPNMPDATREDEILALVDEHDICCWVAVDDRPQEFPRTASTHLVATEYFDGITAQTLVQLSAKIILLSPTTKENDA